MTRRELSIAFQTNKTPAEYVALAQLADTAGFDAITVYNDAPFHPAYAALLLMAPHVKRARIGPATVQPARVAPIDIAAQAALLESLAPGRTYIGLSRGAWLEAHGITPEPKPVTALREAVNVVRYLLRGDTGGVDGDMYRLAEHVRAPYPLPPNAADIPLLIGTWGPQLAAVAGELADEVKVGGTANPDFVPLMRDYIAVGERKAGRDLGTVGVVVGAVCVVDADGVAARALARREVALYLPVVAALDKTLTVEPERVARIKAGVESGDLDDAAAQISDDLLDRFAFSGTPEAVIQQCEGLFDAGTSRIEFGTPHGIDSPTGIQLLAEKVLPALRAP
jgi:5,10-methylenetetrahydromethanopterin reductase